LGQQAQRAGFVVWTQPGLRFATGSGAASLQAVVALWYAKLASITLEQVPYRGGAPAINDLIAGHVKLGSLGTTPLIPQQMRIASIRSAS
jgi:tripartite-type tricarboxylate transporter receptor subunit TctC